MVRSITITVKINLVPLLLEVLDKNTAVTEVGTLPCDFGIFDVVKHAEAFLSQLKLKSKQYLKSETVVKYAKGLRHG